MVYSTILKKKILIPIGVLSTSFLFSTIEKAKAATIPKGVIPQLFGSDKQLKTTDPGFFETWEKIGDTINNIINWFAHFNENISRLSIDFLTHMYELITKVILQTPLILFDNPAVKDANITFSIISILIVTILTMIEGIKRMIPKKRYTDIVKITKRWALVASGMGFAPFVFEKVFWLLNTITQAILKIGSFGIMPNDISNYMQFTGFNTLILIAFDLTILAFAIPILLENGRRWFDIFSLSIVTPLALTTWIFDDYRYLFDRWWNNLQQLGLVQLVYAIFVTIMTIFIFATQYITDGDGLFFKLLIIAGGLFRILNPPSIIKPKLDRESNIVDLVKDYKKTFTTAKNTIQHPININPIKNGVKRYISWYKRNNKKEE